MNPENHCALVEGGSVMTGCLLSGPLMLLCICLIPGALWEGTILPLQLVVPNLEVKLWLLISCIIFLCLRPFLCPAESSRIQLSPKQKDN